METETSTSLPVDAIRAAEQRLQRAVVAAMGDFSKETGLGISLLEVPWKNGDGIVVHPWNVQVKFVVLEPKA